MCQSNKLEMVSQSVYGGYIAFCHSCGRYNLVFENIFLLLSKGELRGLGSMMDDGYGVCTLGMPVGRDKEISIQTPVPNIYFAFTSQEYEEFKRLVNEALLILEAKELIQVKTK